MKHLLSLVPILLPLAVAVAQTSDSTESRWGVVLEHPDMSNVLVKQGVDYSGKGQSSLRLDVYSPHGGSKLPAVIFLPDMLKDKSWQIYKSWARLVACYGLIGVTLDIDKSNYKESVKQAFQFLSENADKFSIDANQLGLFASSHIPDDVLNLFLNDQALLPVKAVALYYRDPSLRGPFNKNVSVLYITDDQKYFTNDRYTTLWNEVQKSKAPWTLVFGAGMPHFFDAFADHDNAKLLIRQTLYFWKNHLEPLPGSAHPPAEDRDMIAALYSGDRLRAADLFKSWLQKHPNDQYALLRYGMVNFLEGNYPEAEMSYKKINNLEPVYQIDLVKILLAQGKASEANKYLSNAMASGKVRRSPYPDIGNFLYGLGQYELAIDYYQHAVEEERRGQDFFNLAKCYIKNRQHDLALEYLEKAIGAGFASQTIYESEKALDPLRSNVRFQKLMSKLN